MFQIFINFEFQTSQLLLYLSLEHFVEHAKYEGNIKSSGATIYIRLSIESSLVFIKAFRSGASDPTDLL